MHPVDITQPQTTKFHNICTIHNVHLRKLDHYISCVLEYKVCTDLLFPLASLSVKISELWDGSVIQDSGPVRRDASPLAQCSRQFLICSGTMQNTAFYGLNNIHGPKPVICVSCVLSSSIEGTLHSGCMGAHNKLGFLTAGHPHQSVLQRGPA
jgi:hypothetical protein